MERGRVERVCVFCGSRPGDDPLYTATANALGGMLASRDIGVVYGGAGIGVMGALADGALSQGGEVIGVIPQSLLEREVGHTGLSELRVVGTMHERKATMAELADAFVVLPGGIGTLEELFEIWTWAHLRIHNKPIGVLNVRGFFDPLHEFVRSLVGAGFLAPESSSLLLEEHDPSELLARIVAAAASAPPAPASSIEP
ncbi:MAG: TIGR00730 family Rossman fold protein [Gaiellaceae bacterium]